MSAPGTFVIFNEFKRALGLKLVSLAADSFRIALVTSASNAINKTLVGATYSALTHELGTANGYTAGGALAASPSWTGGSSYTASLSLGDVSWTVSDAGLTARAAVLYDVTSGHLAGYWLLDSAPADVTIPVPHVLRLALSGDVFDFT